MPVSDQTKALCIFERLTEPVFIPKGENNVVFDVPHEYLVEKYQPIAAALKTRFGSLATTSVTVQPITIPDLSEIEQFPRTANFSIFIPYHNRLSSRLIAIFMGMRDAEDFFSAAAYCRDRVNPFMFVYAFSVALLHRPDTRHVALPPLFEIFPEKFVDSAVFNAARQESNIFVDQSARTPLEIPMDFTASNLEEEHRVAYFREDMGVNLHHWHWHLVYPFTGPREVVSKDRRGELFYYMHAQIMARYDFERLCNVMPRTQPLVITEPLKEGYFPKLDNVVASRVYMPRLDGTSLKDVNRQVDQIILTVEDVRRWTDQIMEAIHKGNVELPEGSNLALDEVRGIDILGNMIEASPLLSPNYLLYGNLHNSGHTLIGFCHDPDNRHLESFGVITDPSTAMRDPAFYHWHGYINSIFTAHKNTLPRYTETQLGNPGVNVTSVEVLTSQGARNVLQTFWQKVDMDLSRGMDFAPRGSVFARLTHLQHTPFQYRIRAENNSGGARNVTVRIFLAPKYNERGLPWQFIDQRKLFIELDRFVVTLKGAPKVTSITRNSSQSTVTIPFERTFRDLEAQRPTAGAALEEFNFCGCGWPQHMLIPKGSAEGFPCQLFVMMSNYNEDRVQQVSRVPGSCADAAAYCGVRDQLYPDKRSMGFPFDRLPRLGVTTLEQFLTPNMAVADVTIKFNNIVQQPKQPAENLIS